MAKSYTYRPEGLTDEALRQQAVPEMRKVLRPIHEVFAELDNPGIAPEDAARVGAISLELSVRDYVNGIHPTL